MQSVARMSQLHANDSEFGTLCPRERQFGPRAGSASKAATSPPQSRKLSLTNGLRRTVFRGPYPYCAKVER
jgi:hypothetical protein